jgi:hypothetical protein
MIHELKIWPEHFDNVVKGIKTFEIRKNDRNYQVGDQAILKRFDPNTKQYTGESCRIYIPYILYGHKSDCGLNPDYCILSVKVINKDNKCESLVVDKDWTF